MKTSEHIFVEINKWAVIALLAAMSVIVFANVCLRYLTNFSLIWAEEVARYLMIWMTFLGAGLALRMGGHVAVTNLHDFMPVPVRRVVRALIAAALFCFFAAMVWFGHDYMTRMGRQLTPATRVPFAYIYAAMPVGFVLLIAHFVLVLKAYVVDEPGGAAAATGPDRQAAGG